MPTPILFGSLSLADHSISVIICQEITAILGDMNAEAEEAGVEAGATDTVDERRAEVGVLVFATRGGCSFEEKAKNAAAAGATGLVVGNDAVQRLQCQVASLLHGADDAPREGRFKPPGFETTVV